MEDQAEQAAADRTPGAAVTLTDGTAQPYKTQHIAALATLGKFMTKQKSL